MWASWGDWGMGGGKGGMMGMGGGKGGGGGTGGGKVKVKQVDDSSWSMPKASGGIPEVRSISLEGKQSMILMEGYAPDAPVLEYSKEFEVFSCGHDILGYFFDEGFDEAVEFIHDPECMMFPCVYQSWKEQGGEDTCP